MPAAAAPLTTTRIDPATYYRYLTNGCITTIAFEDHPQYPLFEVSVTPPGIDNGDEIDTTTMWNDVCRTKYPRCWNEWTPASMRVAYDPEFYTTYGLLIGNNQGVTVTFPNGDTLDFYGYVKSFTPSELEDGKFPEAEVEIVVTNWDPVNCVEYCPVFTESAGTC